MKFTIYQVEVFLSAKNLVRFVGQSDKQRLF